ncbi:AMP-binding protein [Microcoleus sp. AR_TQ3_B6]|uniref:AMP-binding protein n=1 Tax=Microcoleus sp. AR_TQ3_B6 TaxID=3055284 RepID=UPI002FD7738F
MQPSLEIVVGLLGILKADRAYVPLDPAFPEQRLAAMLEDSQVPVLVIYTSGSTGTPKKSRSNTRSFSITSTASSKHSTCQMRVLPPFLPSPPTWATP